ncbi:MAG TPA: NADPH-dependent FMN reductase [Candidatus Margulisiibacteriota bacterium]|nr:NADPH-dependent FMN reductase [Candidatus Margulisiibacteriota bacterium]
MRVLGFAGSLRSRSLNSALLRAAAELAPVGMEVHLFQDIGDIPLFNEDVEVQGDPAPVRAFKAAIQEAAALLIATPEYNYGVPGVLKNAIDWASRPAGKSPLNRKPAAIVGASMGMHGTARAQLALRQTFVFTETCTMLRPELYVSRAHEKFDADGRLVDEPTRKQLQKVLEAFAEWIARFSAR